VITTQGLIGFLLYYALVFTSLFFITRAFLKSSDKINNGILIGFFGSAFVYLGQTLISFGVISTLVFFYLSLGLGTGFALNQLNHPKQVFALTNKFLVKMALVLTAILLVWFGFVQYQSHYYYSRGIENEYKGKGNEALDYYNKSISTLPVNYAAYEKRGDIFLVTAGRQPSLGVINEFLENAIKSYQSSLQYAPGMPHIWGNIAQAYSKMAQVYGLAENKSGLEDSLKKSRVAAEKSLEFGVNNPIFAYSFGEILTDHKLHKESIDYYLQAYNINSLYRQVAFELALAYYETKDYANSRKFLDAAFIKEPDNLDLHRLDTDLKKLGF
jgi:tetratricopeptide (TPR) repeat protein